MKLYYRCTIKIIFPFSFSFFWVVTGATVFIVWLVETLGRHFASPGLLVWPKGHDPWNTAVKQAAPLGARHLDSGCRRPSASACGGRRPAAGTIGQSGTPQTTNKREDEENKDGADPAVALHPAPGWRSRAETWQPGERAARQRRGSDLPSARVAHWACPVAFRDKTNRLPGSISMISSSFLLVFLRTSSLVGLPIGWSRWSLIGWSRCQHAAGSAHRRPSTTPSSIPLCFLSFLFPFFPCCLSSFRTRPDLWPLTAFSPCLTFPLSSKSGAEVRRCDSLASLAHWGRIQNRVSNRKN